MRRLLVAAAVLLAAVRASADDYKGWVGGSAGSWARFTWTSKDTYNSESGTRTETLSRTDDGKLKLEIRTKVTGAETEESRLEPIKPSTREWMESGRESLDVEGQSIECRVLEWEDKDSKSSAKSWRATINGKEVELKSVEHAEPKGKVVEKTLRALNLHEKVTVGKKVIACLVTEFRITESVNGETEAETSIKTWSSGEVPGGVVKVEVRQEWEGMESTETRTLMEFGVPKEE